MSERRRTGSLPLLRLFLCALVAAADSAAQEQGAGSSLQKNHLKFDVVVSNPGRTLRRVTKVGVKSEVSMGTFGCTSAARPDVLLAATDYVVRFYVYEKETVVDADPQIIVEPLALNPKAVMRFTISMVPNATGACGPWSSHVSPIVIFDNGEKLYGRPELLTSADLHALLTRTPAEEEILEALKHRDEEVRRRAIERLLPSTVDIESVKAILEAKLDDPSVAVRLEAARAIAKLGFKSLAGKIAARLRGAEGSRELAGYCEALGALKSQLAVEALVDALSHAKLADLPYVRDALLAIEHPDVPAKVRPLLPEALRALDGSASELEEARFGSICDILIGYRDGGSFATLARALGDARGSAAVWVEAALLKITREDQLTRDSFLLAFRAALMGARKHPDVAVRAGAVEILCRTQPRGAFLEGVLRESLGDAGSDVKLKAADWIARLGYKSMADEIVALAKRSTSEAERARYCAALAKLKVACQ